MMVLYAAQQSEWIVVPAKIHFVIRAIRVARVLLGTGIKKIAPVSRHTPPKTH